MNDLRDFSEDVDIAISARISRPFHPRLTFRRASDIAPLTDGEARAACEMAYRRGFDQGSYIAARAMERGNYDRWRKAVTRWRFQYRTTRQYVRPPEPEEIR